MGETPITWQQTLIVFCALGLLPALVFAWGRNMPDEYRPLGTVAFFTLLVVIALLLLSQHRRSLRPDAMIDLLPLLFSNQAIFQVGPVHVGLITQVNGRRLRLIVVAQNSKDGVGHLKLNIQPQLRRSFQLARSRGIFQEKPDALECALPPASLVMSTLDLTFAPIGKPAEIRLILSGTASASGTLVRFARRKALTKPISEWLTVPLLLLGHVHLSSGGTFIRINYIPTAQDAPPLTRGTANDLWRSAILWTPQAPATREEMTLTLRRAMSA